MPHLRPPLTRVLASIVWLCAAVAWSGARAEGVIVAEGVVDAPVAAVWNAWTTSEGLRAWLAPHAEIDLRIGGLMRSNHDAAGTVTDAGAIENRVLSFEPERMLSIQVTKPPADFPFRRQVASMWTVLYFQPTADGKTMLRIVGLGFADDPESLRMKAFFERGNAFTLAKLQRRFKP